MRRFAEQLAWPEGRGFAIDAAVNERMGFIRRTYSHLLIEICCVGVLASLVIKTPFLLNNLAIPLASNILIYVLAFFGVSLLSRKLLEGGRPLNIQYLGAGLWVFFLGVLVAPFAWITKELTGSYDIVGQAFLLTALVFGGLTAYVFMTKKDFSFLGGGLAVVSMALFGIGVVMAIFGGGALGSIWWSVLWVLLLGGWVLYDTSRVLHHRNVRDHVAASVDLLVDFVYMFIYILMILLRSRE